MTFKYKVRNEIYDKVRSKVWNKVSDICPHFYYSPWMIVKEKISDDLNIFDQTKYMILQEIENDYIL